MWERLGETRVEILPIFLAQHSKYTNIRLSWERKGLLHMCSLDTMVDIPDEELEGVEVFTVWATGKQYPDKRPHNFTGSKEPVT